MFNRYGQHVATKDLSSSKTRYSFLYSKNTSFGKLSTVTDSTGNKIQFLRDYSNIVSSIENTQDHKSELKISANGLLIKILEKGRTEIEFDYDSNSGLMMSKSNMGDTIIYQYDDFGRLINLIMPSGEQIRISSNLEYNNLGLDIKIATNSPQLFIQQQDKENISDKLDYTDLTLKGGIKKMTMIKQDELYEAQLNLNNNTMMMRSPNGIMIESNAVAEHPILKTTLPIEAEMLPMWSHQKMVMGDNLVNNMYSKYTFLNGGNAGTASMQNHPQQILQREIWVNSTRVLGLEFEQFMNFERFYNKDKETILTIQYDQSGLPQSYIPTNLGHPLNMTYDRFNRIVAWQWGPAQLEYTYDRHGLLSEVTSHQDGTISYVYNDWNLISEIGLASQRKFLLTYDTNGGLRHVQLPSGTKHSFSLQPSIGFIRSTYTPPGSTKPYLQHYSYSGTLLQTIYPGDGARIIYRYHKNGLLSEIIHGDGRSEFSYNSVTGSPSTVLHIERELEYRWDYDYVGGLLAEERIDYSAKTGLSNAKFQYEYDTNFRLQSIQGRIGGQSLPVQQYTYNQKTGQPEQICQFKIVKPTYNKTNVYDYSSPTPAATFSRTVDGRYLEREISLTIRHMQVFRMEFSHDTHGRISQTRTYTRNVGVNYTNVKNYTWDCDGQLIGVEAQEPWGFRYDDNGNMLSLTYRGNPIPMEYNAMDRIVKFGEGQYKYDPRGLVAQNAREERFHYNTQGLLIRATKRGRFNVQYYYDHLNRLTTRKDNFGNVTQFFYNNQERLHEVSQIYSPRDGKLMSLIYDDRGHLIYTQFYRHKYYVATDQCGTPIMIFNQYGEGVREIMRSPYGHIVYDSNPYLYLPIDFCGGLLDQVSFHYSI